MVEHTARIEGGIIPAALLLAGIACAVSCRFGVGGEITLKNGMVFEGSVLSVEALTLKSALPESWPHHGSFAVDGRRRDAEVFRPQTSGRSGRRRL